MQGNFDTCLDQTAVYEGGYSNHPKDPGGSTYKGVTQARYDLARERWGEPRRDVRQMNEAEWRRIYHDFYWVPVHGDELKAGVDNSTFDGGVNSGTSRGIKWLQGAIGARVDGQFGPETSRKAAAADAVKTIHAINDRRLGFMKSLRIWSTFGKGWSRRVASVRAASLVMWANATKRDPVIVLEENLPVTAGKEANARTGAAQAGTAGAGAGGGGVLTNLNGDWVTTALLVVLALVLLVALARFAARARHSRLATEAMQSEITRLKKEANA
ncbi:MAG: glycoside hydrolase family 108 protein [Hyphomicrobiaceae bacterium]|nr:glycoside hydrolase family 108 protein [Hyphomicrobiaceae bacterium]MCC0024640.1 glycoside hydrolase family 108 protein [Hyphomicrobiaceae bacterium]